MRRWLLCVVLASAGCSEARDLSVAAPPSGDGELPGGCLSDEAHFEHRVWTPLLAPSCTACHSIEGLARDSRFILSPGDDAASMRLNFAVTRAIAGIEHDGESILLLRPSGEHADGHPGGALAPRGSAEFAALAELVLRARGEAPDSCATPVPSDPPPEDPPPEDPPKEDPPPTPPPSGEPDPDPCVSDQAHFRVGVWGPVLSLSCIACHREGGLATGSRFRLEAASDEDAHVRNFQVTRDIARLEHDGESVLLLRPAGLHPAGHPGGTLTPVGSEAYGILEDFVARAQADSPQTCQDPSETPVASPTPAVTPTPVIAPTPVVEPTPAATPLPTPVATPTPSPLDDDDDCPSDEEQFRDEVWGPIMSVSCVGCHSPLGVAAQSELVLSSDPDGTRLLDNLAAARSAAQIDLNGQSILLLRPSGRHPAGHPGGVLTPPGSPAHAALSRFVARALAPPGTACDVVNPDDPDTPRCEDIAPGRRRLRRLTRVEYDNTVRDLLGLDERYGAAMAPDVVVHGFDNNSDALSVTPLLADQLREAAEALAAAADLNRLLPCNAAEGRACSHRFIVEFGERAFRRPVTAEDVERYQALYDAGDGLAFNDRIRLLITGMLQSPFFLYRSELGTGEAGAFELTPWEIASELSYLFWGTMPDAALFDAARSGALADPAEQRAQAQRLLADPRAAHAFEVFTTQWLAAGQVQVVPKDNAVYPELDADLREEMDAELRGFMHGAETFEEVMRQPASPGGALGAMYGDSPRPGVLALGAVLASHAHPDGTSPVHRGRLVRERVLCQALPEPPPGINADPPAHDSSLTTRQRFAQHSTDSACSVCHRLMDPIGFAFENYDGMGRYREEEHGLPIDVSGEILGSPRSDGPFEGVAGLAARLAQSEDAQACFSTQWTRFAYGLEETDALSCLFEEVAEGFAAGEHRIDALLYALVDAPHFTQRLGETTELSVGDGDSAPPPEPSPEPLPDDPEPQAGVVIEVRPNSDWGAGYCERIGVMNTGDADVDWIVYRDLDGTLRDHWGSMATSDGSRVRFEGVHWNNVLPPGASTEFGYCVVR